ncbi:ras association domain-containing protein 8 isoform X2 [Bemisia tabaci]|uniref:ras association domain-containing protein 8 isoform X2 n=1 Tax=Bemisia tabaci TaxID=7038 RepID=UPI0008F9DE4B|nr:PREDICTED: ras association domain-containing protein 8 isoform X2 [Bemisia tabaci]
MELKVWVEGIQRIVCGVTESTTCQDVVYALAHATGKTGRFSLTERWRNNERLLSPQDQPLQVLMKWGEYSNDVQFILQRSASSTPNANNNSSHSQGPISPTASLGDASSFHERNKDIRKSLTFSGASNRVEHRRGDNGTRAASQQPQSSPTAGSTVSNSLHVKDKETGPYCNLANSCEPFSSSQQVALNSVNGVGGTPPSNGRSPAQRVLPPYRDPPPPSVNPARVSPPNSITSIRVKPKRSLLKELQQTGSANEALLLNSQYRDLVRLVNCQRDKLSVQQAELSKYDAEILYWEGKTREQHHQMEYLAQEVARVEAIGRQTEDQLQALGQIEEENEIVHQQEKTLKSEMTLLRSKLANCETELLQCKNKIRLLMEEVQMEQRLLARETEEKQHLERSILAEVERLQQEVEQVKQDTEMAAQCGDSLHREVASLEAAMIEKKRQVEKLVNDMKEANLQSLAVAPAEELKLLLEGPHKPGSIRRMIGSPRQLENAVPTSKNPHGVWV